MSLSSRSIKRPVAVAMLFVAIGVLGAISFERIPIDLLPDVSYPELVVFTTYPDVAPTEVEQFVTEPVEQAVSAVPGVQSVESVSREGTSLVTLRFAWGTDMDFAVLNVRERLDNLRDRLPEESDRPVVLRTDPTAEPIMAISVAGGNDLFALKELAQEVFKRRLEQIDGVAQAALAGGLEREIHVAVNPRLLDSYNVELDDVIEALDAANQSAPGGTVRRGRFRYSLRTIGEFRNLDEIRAVPLSRAGGDSTAIGGVVTLGDVAEISEGFRDRESIARYNLRDAVGLLLFKEAGANTVRTAQKVDEVLEQLRAENPQLRIEVAMTQAQFISDAISSVVQALLYGGVLSFLVLFLFLQDVRYPVAIGLAIPISVIAAFPLLDMAGVTLNIMSLGGLALGVGMLVDNSIVVLENIFRHRQLGKSPAAAAAAGAEEVQGAITASTLTTISVFGPIIYVQGVAGQLFGAVSFAVAFALAASLLVALTLLPTIAARWNDAAGEAEAGFAYRFFLKIGRGIGRLAGKLFGPFLVAFDRMFTRFAQWYHDKLELALDHRGAVVGASAGVLLLGLALGVTLDRSVLPDVDQGSFQMRLRLDRGTPIDQTSETARRLEEALNADPEIEAVFSRVGRQMAVEGVGDEQSGINTAVVDVRLVEGAKTLDVIERMASVFATFPAGVLAVVTGEATNLGRLLGSSDADLAVRVRSDNLVAANLYASQIEQVLAGLESLTNVRTQGDEGQPEVLIEVDRDRAAAFGIEPRLVAQTVEGYMRGRIATEFVEFDQKIPIVVRLPDAERRSLASLELLNINGIPLRELITTREAVGPAEVRRLDQTRVVTVYADVASGGLDAALSDVRSVISETPPPARMRVEVGGENEERAKSFRSLGFAFLLALLLVYMILAAQFESFVHPFTILLSVPLATVGASLALWISGSGLNTMSLIGLIILVGIVVNDAIVKVDFINQNRVKGSTVREAILEAGRVRLRPIIMTTVTTVLGLAPMALGLGRGSDLRAPLAIAVIGGLLSATLLTLFVVPVGYDLVEQAGHGIRSAFGRPSPQPAADRITASPARGDT